MLGQLIDSEDLFTPLPKAEAERKARHLNSEDEDGWTYVAIHAKDGIGSSYIAVYDEESVFLGKL